MEQKVINNNNNNNNVDHMNYVYLFILFINSFVYHSFIWTIYNNL